MTIPNDELYCTVHQAAKRMTLFGYLCDECADVPDPAPLGSGSRANARATDPGTSHAAARSVRGRLRDTQAAVLAAFRQAGPMTDEALHDAYPALQPAVPQSPSGLRTRRAELVDEGYVRDSGVKTALRSGRLGIVWEAR